MRDLPKDPNDYHMLTRGYVKEIRELAKRSAPAFQMLMLLVERMSRANAVVVSQSTLCTILGYSRTAIHKATRVLESEKWVQIVKVGTANAYVVNSKVIWRTHKGERYGSFYAEVLVSEAEQGREAESWDDVELRHLPVLKYRDTAVEDGVPLPPPDQQDLLPLDQDELPRAGGAFFDDEQADMFK